MVLISVSTGQEDLRLDIGVTLLFIGWLGGTVHAIFLNRDYLRWRATRGDEPWYAQEGARSTESQFQQAGLTMTGTAPPTSDAAPDRILGVDEADYYSLSPRPDQRAANPTPVNLRSKSNTRLAPPVASPTPGQPTSPSSDNRVDVNTSNARALAELPGLDLAWAHHIISVREARRRFHNLNDFVTSVGLQPHQLIKLKPYVVVIDAANQAQQSRTGRILDL
jgi:Helix-hairpin-helix motif